MTSYTNEGNISPITIPNIAKKRLERKHFLSDRHPNTDSALLPNTADFA